MHANQQHLDQQNLEPRIRRVHRVTTGRKHPTPPAPKPMPAAPETLLIADLTEAVIAAITARHDRKNGNAKIRYVRLFCWYCEDAGVTQLPHERLAELANAYLETATTMGTPSPSMRACRRAAARSILKTALRRGLVVPDPFATTYDRVVAGENVPVATRLQLYLPSGLDQIAFARVQPLFVAIGSRALTADVGLGYTNLCAFLSRLLVWCDQQGISMEPASVLNPDTIDRHLRSRFADGTGSFGAGRSVLTRCEWAFNPKARRRPLRRPDAQAPYTPSEVDALITWVKSLTGRHRYLWVLVVFGLGAGFDVTAIRFLRGTHIARHGDLVVVHDPSERAHPVPIEPEWEDEALRLAAEAGGEYLFNPAYRGRLNPALVYSLLGTAGAGTPHLDCRRLRTTWIVGHLVRGTDAFVLMHLAGLTSLGSLDRYVEFLSWPGDEAAMRILRGDR